MKETILSHSEELRKRAITVIILYEASMLIIRFSK